MYSGQISSQRPQPTHIGLAKALLKVIHFVEYFKPHPLPVFLPIASAAGYIGKAVRHARGVDAPPFSDPAVVRIEDVLHGKAGTGGTDEIAAAAVDTATVILFPHFRSGHTGKKIAGEGDAGSGFRNMRGSNLPPFHTVLFQQSLPMSAAVIDKIAPVGRF